MQTRLRFIGLLGVAFVAVKSTCYVPHARRLAVTVSALMTTIAVCGVFSAQGGVTSGAGHGPNSQGFSAFAINSRNPQIVYAGSGRGVFKSSDGGGSWQAVNVGLTGRYIFDLAIDQHQPATLYAATGTGVFKSTNAGRSWRATSSPRVRYGRPRASSAERAGALRNDRRWSHQERRCRQELASCSIRPRPPRLRDRHRPQATHDGLRRRGWRSVQDHGWRALMASTETRAGPRPSTTSPRDTSAHSLSTPCIRRRSTQARKTASSRRRMEHRTGRTRIEGLSPSRPAGRSTRRLDGNRSSQADDLVRGHVLGSGPLQDHGRRPQLERHRSIGQGLRAGPCT